MVWKTLHHPNVLPLLGAAMGKTQLTMASEWMVNGNVNEFTKAHVNVDRLGLVGSRFKLHVFVG